MGVAAQLGEGWVENLGEGGWAHEEHQGWEVESTFLPTSHIDVGLVLQNRYEVWHVVAAALLLSGGGEGAPETREVLEVADEPGALVR